MRRDICKPITGTQDECRTIIFRFCEERAWERTENNH
jgi:hypothetical protein